MLAVALGLWVLAGLVIMPFTGWGVFGAGLGTATVLNILAVHVLYGLFLWAGFWAAFRGTAPGVPSSGRALSAEARVTGHG